MPPAGFQRVALRVVTRTAFVAMCGLAFGATQARAQSATGPTTASSQQLSQDLIKTLQPVRPLTSPPPVAQVVLTVRVDGGSAMVPVTAAMALGDVRLHNEQLKSVYPKSQAYYPTDSITEAKRARAAEWVTRMNGVSAAEQAYAVKGWQRVPLAEVAAEAGNDSMARRLFDTRIAELAKAPVERSHVLYEVIATLANPTQDSVRLVRNLALAEKYLKSLQAISTTGFKTRHDSVTILYNQWRAEDTLIVGFDAASDTNGVLVHARRLLPWSLILGVNERTQPTGLAYGRVVHALGQTPEGRAQIAAFAAPVVTMAHRLALEALPANVTADDRRRLEGFEPEMKRYINEVTEWFALLGTPASSLTSHLWLNLNDSLYAPTPRSRVIADGRVHMIVFGYYSDEAKLAVLSRAHAKFPKDFEPLLVTTTGGTAGPDIVGPKEEAEWLTKYLRGVKHFTMPIGVWAAEKEQVGFVPEGHYPVFRPKETPNEKPYDARMLGMACILIDKHGAIRFYQDIDLRKDEEKLFKRIQLLLDEPASAPAAKADASAPAVITASNSTGSAHVSQ